MGLGQYESLEEYCGPPTASSVFLIFIYKLYNGDNLYSHNIQLSMDITHCLLNTDDTVRTKVTSAFSGRYQGLTSPIVELKGTKRQQSGQMGQNTQN